MTAPEFLARPRAADGSPSLTTHLDETREKVRLVTTDDGALAAAAEVAAYLHDFGKLTTYFQEYIEAVATDEGGWVHLTREEQKRKQHARLSAYAVEYALKKRGVEPHWRVCAFLAVAKHHQSLSDTEAEIQRTTNLNLQENAQRFDLIQKQLANIYNNAADTADTLLQEASDGEGSLDDFVAYLHNCRPHKTLEEYTPDARTYAALMHLWGILTTADKLASAALNVTAPPLPSPGAIDDHIAQLPPASTPLKRQLNSHRETARQSVLGNLQAFQTADTDLATITLPTGFGKTLTGLQAALSVAGSQGRVIYALPYTSIIDQVDEVVREVFSVAPTDPQYTIHHHLAETRTLPEDSRVDTDDAELLAETWQAPLVLTTFVQVFESLAGPTNRQSMKLPALENAVVVLDEPQALPKKWWRFVTWASNLLVEEFDATVILMTATQPELLRRIPHGDDPFELVGDVDSHFQFLAENPRVRYRLHDSVQEYINQPRAAPPLPVDDAVSHLVADDTTSVLSVGNTVTNVTEQGRLLEQQLSDSQSLNRLLGGVYRDRPSAEAFADDIVAEVVKRARAHGGPLVATLTARLRPLDRTILLQAIRHLLETECRLYVVSTQLIEAGVDVSFDCLYRDLAPFPSLVQAAGRCNREFGGDTATVTIWRLAGQDDYPPPSQLIYGDPYNLLAPTRKTLGQLESQGCISEYEMARDGAAEYFRWLHTETSPGDRELVRAAEHAEFGTLGEQSLIRERGDRVDIFIAVTENETRLFDAYRTFAAQNEYRRLRSLREVIESRTVSVPLKCEAKDHPDLVAFPDMDDMFYLEATDMETRSAVFEGAGI